MSAAPHSGSNVSAGRGKGIRVICEVPEGSTSAIININVRVRRRRRRRPRRGGRPSRMKSNLDYFPPVTDAKPSVNSHYYFPPPPDPVPSKPASANQVPSKPTSVKHQPSNLAPSNPVPSKPVSANPPPPKPSPPKSAPSNPPESKAPSQQGQSPVKQSDHNSAPKTMAALSGQPASKSLIPHSQAAKPTGANISLRVGDGIGTKKVSVATEGKKGTKVRMKTGNAEVGVNLKFGGSKN